MSKSDEATTARDKAIMAIDAAHDKLTDDIEAAYEKALADAERTDDGQVD